MTDKLIPCPFCGSSDLKWDGGEFVHCNQCSADGPYSCPGADVLWNTRPPLSDDELSGLVEPRFFIDHGMIHDRLTGKHIDTEPVEYDEGKFDLTPINEACELLNNLWEGAGPTGNAQKGQP